MRRNLFGYAYQFHYLLDDLTVFENCNLVFKIANNKKVDENLKRICKFLMSLELLHCKISTHICFQEESDNVLLLQEQLVHEPNFVLMDEPTGNLDQENAEVIQNLTIKLAKNHNIGIVVATHDLNYAGKLDAVFRIENGDLKSA